MRSAKTIFLAVLLLALLQVEEAGAQVQTARFTSMVPHTNAYYEYVPEGYPEPNKKYPLLIFLHGLGETGPGTAASLPAVLRNGPPKLINEGKFPKSFTVNNVNYKFLVISPQFNEWPTENDVDNIIDYLIAHYPVDINRVYLTGLSMGGGTVWNYSGNDISHATRVAGIVPVCGAGYPYQSHARTMASANLPVWATHNSIDGTVPPYYTIDYVNLINTAPVPPNPLAKKTIFTVPSNNHDAWSRTYDTSFRENGLNVYEWMLQYRRFLTVLPVTGLNLNAALINNKVALQWLTAGEVNVLDFTVQRSADGIAYNDIATLNSTGVNGAGASYVYQDINPPAGITYYRIKVQDTNGDKTFSDVKTVDIRKGSSINIYPNPASRELKILSTSTFNNSIIQISNTAGQVVLTKRLNGNAPYTFDIATLPAGTYYAIIDDKKGKQQFSFVKR
ncbi:MAG: T9SS type A sorting domain-containing protein [Rhizobacter sp.]|nr:T9SS type A sorting domain-containing protein [Ferruginibacter sp.]